MAANVGKGYVFLQINCTRCLNFLYYPLTYVTSFWDGSVLVTQHNRNWKVHVHAGQLASVKSCGENDDDITVHSKMGRGVSLGRRSPSKLSLLYTLLMDTKVTSPSLNYSRGYLRFNFNMARTCLANVSTRCLSCPLGIQEPLRLKLICTHTHRHAQAHFTYTHLTHNETTNLFTDVASPSTQSRLPNPVHTNS